jgi:hypothetical protein
LIAPIPAKCQYPCAVPGHPITALIERPTLASGIDNQPQMVVALCVASNGQWTATVRRLSLGRYDDLRRDYRVLSNRELVSESSSDQAGQSVCMSLREVLMATMEEVDSRDGQSKVAAPPRRNRVLVVLITVVAVVLAAFIGWTIGGSESEPDVYVIGGGELTERQEEMVRVADEFDAALRDGDGEALLALFVPQGVLSVPGEPAYRADNGTLAEFMENRTRESLVSFPPTLVMGDSVLRYGSYDGEHATLTRFTPSGDVLIIRATLTPV